MVTIPSFSIPKTRKEFDTTRIFLTTFFKTNEGLNQNDASRLASQIISYKSQGLTSSQITKNLQDDLAFRDEKKIQKEKELEALKQTEKQKLIQKQIADAKKRSEELAKRKRTSIERTSQQVRNFVNSKKSEPLVANPDNPRGKLIPKSQADAILLKRKQQGKTTKTSSVTQTKSIIDRLRESLKSKSDTNVTVVDLNRTSVLLSNGKLIPRDQFKGIIPKELLISENKKFPQNNVTTLADIERNKAIITNPSLTTVQSPIKTDNTASNIGDLSKIPSTTKRPSKSVFQNDKPETTPITNAFETISNSVTGFFESISNPTPEAKAEDNKPTEIFDPLKSITDFFGSIIPKQNEEPKPTETKTEPEQKPITTPTETKTEPETKLTISDSKLTKVKQFASNNSFAIVGTAISLMSLIAFLSVPREVRTEITRRN